LNYGGWGKRRNFPLSNGQLSDGFAMPRYFFSLVVDSEGQELADDDAAGRHAVLVAEKLTKYGRAPREGKIVVTNESGEVVYTQPFAPLTE
jgi:hypothetical protein